MAVAELQPLGWIIVLLGEEMLLSVVTATLVVSLLQAQVPSEQDVAVFEAVLASKIRPEVDRFSSGAGMETPAPVFTFDTTIMFCPPARRPPRMGCIHADEVAAFEAPSDRWLGKLPFDGLLSATSRAQLGRSFRERNGESHPFPGNGLDGLLVVRPDQLDEALKRESSRTRGFSSFSLPAYSTDGHALVYASYVCGGLCGEGWFFLLHRQRDEWRVLDVRMLWIS